MVDATTPSKAQPAGGDHDDSILALASHVATLAPGGVPGRELFFQASRVLDNLGTLAAGWNAAAVPELHGHKKERSGVPQFPALIHGTLMPLSDAVFLNSVMARAHDFCDVVSPGYHPGSSDVPIALAMAYHYGRSGKDMLEAMVIGLDVALRINQATQAGGHGYKGFDPNVLALFSGTAIAARLAGLDARATMNAFGFAFNHGVGTFQMYSDKVLAVRLAQGTVSAACVQAVQYAALGLTGVARILDGPNGFFRQYSPAEPERSYLVHELGEVFQGEKHVCFKLFPSCSVTLALTEAALRLRHRLGKDNVSIADMEISLTISPVMLSICGHPFTLGDNPTVNAMFSVQYVVASALVRGRSSLFEFTEQAVSDPAIVRLALRIVVLADDQLARFDACSVQAEQRGGMRYCEAAHTGRGWPPNSPSPEELIQKFHTNIEFAQLPWLSRNSEALIGSIENLAQAPNVDKLVSLLVPAHTSE